MMSSPGAGKTTLLERTIRGLRPHRHVSVVEGDQETALAAERIRATGRDAYGVLDRRQRAIDSKRGRGPSVADMTREPTLLMQTNKGVLVTLKRDGRPQLSNINYAYDAATRTVRISVTDDRAKTRNLRRDPRASLHVASDDFWSYEVVEGTASLSEVTTDPHDDAAEELVHLYRDVTGEHPDWDEYRQAMIDDRRLVVRLPVEHVYGVTR